MAEGSRSSGGWVYPDWDAWQKLLHLRPKPAPVMNKPPWWQDPWPLGRSARAAAGLTDGRRLELIRSELTWAQKCFYYAQSALPDSLAKAKAGRIAEIIGRARRAIDTAETARGMERAIDELAGVGQYDPEKYPRAFVEAAGRSISAAGHAMESARQASLGYWGRVFVRAGGYFRSMGHELPEP